MMLDITTKKNEDLLIHTGVNPADAGDTLICISSNSIGAYVLEGTAKLRGLANQTHILKNGYHSFTGLRNKKFIVTIIEDLKHICVESRTDKKWVGSVSEVQADNRFQIPVRLLESYWYVIQGGGRIGNSYYKTGQLIKIPAYARVHLITSTDTCFLKLDRVP